MGFTVSRLISLSCQRSISFLASHFPAHFLQGFPGKKGEVGDQGPLGRDGLIGSPGLPGPPVSDCCQNCGTALFNFEIINVEHKVS